MDQRYVPLSFQQTAGGLTVTAPPDANTAPPGYYMLWIVNSRGVPSIAPFVHFAPDQQAPTAPQSMTAQGAIGQVTLNWLASTDNVGIAQYTIYRSTTPNFTPSASNRIGQTTATSYLDSSLPAGTYYYEVTAQDAVGNVSPASNQVTAVSAAPPIHVVQHAANGFESNVSQISLAFPGSVTAGDFLIITGTAARPREQITISDSAGNTFVPAFGPVSDPAQDVTAYVWYVVNARGGPDTITLTPVGGPDAMEIHISEWTGINQVSPIDRVSSATGNGTQITSGTKTTTQNGELIFGYTFPNQNATAGAGFTGLSLINGDLDEYQIQNTAGPIAATWTQAADNWFGVMVTFRAADADTEPPTAPSSLTANGGLGTAALSWAAATDNLAVDHYNIYRSTTSGSAGALVGQSNITSFTDGGLAAGTYYYTVVAVDGAGNTSSASNQASALVTADMVPPSVAIFSPADGATVSGAVQLSATATDDVGVASVTFYVDGIQIGAPVTSAPYAITWGSAGVANGSHVLTATAKDLSGNPTTSDAITVNVQNVVTGLVASYSFDEGAGNTLNDQSGNGNNGSVNNATWSSGGRYGGALLFTGSTSSFVQIASSAALQLTKGMTLEAWVNPSSLASPDGGWCAVIAKDHANSSNDIAYALYAAQGTNTGPSGHILVSSRDYGTTGGSKLALNGWAFLTVTYNGSVLSTYLNGVLLGSKSISGSIFTGADPLKIGGDWSGEMFTGLIDNVRLYNRALSATEIQSDMATAVPTASSGGGGSQAGEAATVAAALPASSSAASPTPAPMFSTLRVSRRDLDSLLDRHRRHRRR
jgi:fibronectin type 3 domain-containing protein